MDDLPGDHAGQRTSTGKILALEEFKSLGIAFVSYQENIDPSKPLDSLIEGGESRRWELPLQVQSKELQE